MKYENLKIKLYHINYAGMLQLDELQTWLCSQSALQALLQMSYTGKRVLHFPYPFALSAKYIPKWNMQTTTYAHQVSTPSQKTIPHHNSVLHLLPDTYPQEQRNREDMENKVF